MRLYCASCLLIMASLAHGKRDIEAEKNPEFWKNLAKQELDVAMKTQEQNTNVAKNVIIFLGDGMGLSTITAGRILKGQLRGESGEETKLVMDQFPHAALSKTYSADKQVADSAATGTAYLCGVKTNYHTVGVSAAAKLGDCESVKGNEVQSVLMDFHAAGKSTGVVTTTRINHATPSATYAHSADRKWYGDAYMPNEAKKNGCKDIALQFLEASDNITVAMGGGRKYFQPNTTFDPEYKTKRNTRLDGRDLIASWKQKMTDGGLAHQYVWNKEQFDAVDPATTDRLLGLFQPSDMNYDAERSSDGAGEPSIAEMTQKAIEILRKNDKGYYLLVEGGRIDHAHHGGNAYLSLHDVVAFDNAIEKAVEMTSDEDTLIVVTADHSHVFTMGGYADRGNDIFGLAPAQNNSKLALDDKVYTTLLYANGPGYHGYHYRDPSSGYITPNVSVPTQRQNLSGVDTTAHDYMQQSAVPLSSETHGGEDVAILARGPMAHLFHGVHEQVYIAYVMRYAACVGPNKDHCEASSATSTRPTVETTTVPIALEYLGSSISTQQAEHTMKIQFAFLIILSVIVLVLIVIIVQQRRNGKKSDKNNWAGETSVPLNSV